VSDATFPRPDPTTFCRLDELGLVVTGQRLEPDHAVLACRVVEHDQWCRRCGCEGAPRDTITRELAHEPFGWRPTTLEVTVRRYRCTGCGHVWRQDTSAAAQPRAKLSRRGLRWALEAIVCQHLSVARVAEGLAVAWNTANDAVLAEGKRVLIEDPGRFDGVTTVGVDEHVVRHEALFVSDGGGRPTWPGRRSGEVKLAVVGPGGRRVLMGAAATKSGRFGTTGRAVPGEQNGKVYARNRCRKAS